MLVVKWGAMMKSLMNTQSAIGICATLLFVNPAFADQNLTLEERIEKLEKQSEVKGKSHGGWYNFRGRMHLDSAGFNSREGGRDFGAGTQLRRARLGLEGGFYEDWRWRIEADFAPGNSVNLQDAFLQYRGFNNTILTVGQQLAPTSMSTLSGSAQVLPFMERGAVVNAFDRFRTIGASAWYSPSKHWFLQAAYHSEAAGTSASGVGAAGDNSGHSNNFHGRVGITPVNEERSVVYLGMSGHLQTHLMSDQVRFGDRPEMRVDNYRIVDTGNIPNVRSTDQFVVDAFVSHGPFHLQGEYWNRGVSRKGGEQNLNFDGFYVQAAYILTGEHKPYTSYGRYGRIIPKSNFKLGWWNRSMGDRLPV
jgi:phosphate-selective porin OprO and OprP